MRGNLGLIYRNSNDTGSIPAHAGKPAAKDSASTLARVYPRACGETSTLARSPNNAAGLSPRMRGNPSPDAVPLTWVGSIPAHAGKPNLTGTMIAPGRVYPRACGETTFKTYRPVSERGLSPRMRGNPPATAVQPIMVGSIPAHAGKPNLYCPQSTGSRVYPRACGET